MCISCPAKVLSRSEGKAEIVDVVGRQRQVICPIDAKVGDYVIIGMGHAVDRISKKEYDALAKDYPKEAAE